MSCSVLNKGVMSYFVLFIWRLLANRVTYVPMFANFVLVVQDHHQEMSFI